MFALFAPAIATRQAKRPTVAGARGFADPYPPARGRQAGDGCSRR